MKILARELAIQIQKVVLALGDFMDSECHACIGGTNVREDMKNLEQGGKFKYFFFKKISKIILYVKK